MKTVGVICEYNPFHKGHAYHIEETRRIVSSECAIVCVMSGNYVQRGEPAVFNKHARAQAAVHGGADLVVELPAPYALQSAEGFAAAGVHLLDSMGVCGYISFGSESGDIEELACVSKAIATPEASVLMKEWLGAGLPYASAQQKAADAMLGKKAEALKSPNNLLGVEYLKALSSTGSAMQPITVKRAGGDHDGETGYSASAIRKNLLRSEATEDRNTESILKTEFVERLPELEAAAAAQVVPAPCAAVFDAEIEAGRGPISMESFELAMLSRLRAAGSLSGLPGATEGLDRRILKYIASEATVAGILEKTKTKRYPMSRLRRMLLCACLGIDAADMKEPPPYIRVLAMNATGMETLKTMRKKAALPIITKPASVKKLSGRAVHLFNKEVAATDFYVLAYANANMRSGGQEWRISPMRCSGSEIPR